MELVEIIRVQDQYGAGHYNGSYIGGFAGTAPMPEDDGIPYVPSHMHFGFASKEQALNWFESQDYRERMVREGRRFICVFQVPAESVRHGRSQVVFDMAAAKLVKHIPAEEWVSGRLNMVDGNPYEEQPND